MESRGTHTPASQNITLRMDRQLLRKARILAAQRGTSVSKLLTEYLEQMLETEDAYQEAETRALKKLEQGRPLGGRIPCSRDEWHER